MILGLQVIAVIFSFVMIYFALLNFRRREINKTDFISWMIIWSFTIFIVIFPEILRDYSKRFLITRLFDLLIVGGFILVITMVSRVYISVKKMEKIIEKVIRVDALKNVRKKK